MPKVSKQYLEVLPFSIVEKGFHKERDQVSESIFSLGNEYMGIRGFFEEGYSGKKLIGSYFNGIYEYALEDTPNAYKGIIKRTHFMINSVNYLKCSIKVDDEILDLNNAEIKDFYRELDMHTGLYKRKFTWLTKKGELTLTFERLLDMEECHEATQRITFASSNPMPITFTCSLDSNAIQWGKDCYWKRNEEWGSLEEKEAYLFVETLTTKQTLCSYMHIDASFSFDKVETTDKEVTFSSSFVLNKEATFTRYVVNIIDKEQKEEKSQMIKNAKNELKRLKEKRFDGVLKDNQKHFDRLWERSDIEIEGDDKDQQGIRYCIFQLDQTYHGYAKDNNIGAKGLTGEMYSGHAFWDSETYCLPFYLFSNQEASKNLLMFRYHTLKEAKERAKQLDCEGACYPVATRNGKEACNLFQHASLQFQPSTAVAYAIFHYMNLYHDEEFMNNYGLEMLVEITHFLLTRGQYNATKERFGFYSVMGPDEFQMMVNHNTYTNFMAKKTMDYLLSLKDKYDLSSVLSKCGVDEKFLEDVKKASEKMVILYDKKTHLFEQHEGFFDLPHIDIHQIPESDFPLYSHWSYDRIYRNDMIKQPDVLMFMFLYNQDFSEEEKKANYEYYEPRCIHESSLSPSIHSIFACELHKMEEAENFFNFATRLDLDDYNCNTLEGIHTTSIAAAWMNIVYGFGGLRSDREILKLNPTILPSWKSYSFKILYHGSILKIKVTQENVIIENEGNDVLMEIYGEKTNISHQMTFKRKN